MTMPYGFQPTPTADSAPQSPGKLVCPWMRRECPGQENCAPAVIGRLSPVCPIVAGVEVLEIFAMMARPLIDSMTKVEGTSPEVSPRDAYIRKVLKPDQLDRDQALNERVIEQLRPRSTDG